MKTRPQCLTISALLLALGLWIGGCQPFSQPEGQSKRPASPRFEVVFDQSYEQVYSPLDTSFTGYSELTILIRAQGGAVALNHSPLHRALPRTRARHTVLVLGVAMFQRYTPQDLGSIHAFLRRGGGVLVMVEHEDLMENATFQNALLEACGVKALPSVNKTLAESRSPLWTWCNVPRWRMAQVQFFLPAPLRVDADKVSPLAKIRQPQDPTRAVVAARARGVRLTVVGDAEIAWNGDKAMGIGVGENRVFLARVLTDLADVPYAKRPLAAEQAQINDTKKAKRALCLRDGQAVVPERSACGLSEWARVLRGTGYAVDVAFSHEVDLQAYDLVMLFNPLRPLPQPERLTAARKLLLVADGQADLCAAEPFLAGMIQRRTGCIVARAVLPINAVARHAGLRFAASTLVNRTDRLAIEVRWQNGRTSHLFRATHIRPTDGDRFRTGTRVLARSAPTCWPSACLTPLQVFEKPTRPFQPPKNKALIKSYPVIVATDRVMAVADLEPFLDPAMDEAGGERLWEVVAAWAEAPERE